jgi:hypothetical protein
MSIQSICNLTATFERKTVAQDALKLGHNETFATAYADVAIALQPANGRTVEEFSRAGFQVSHMVYTATAMTILAGDRMIVDGAYYIVQGPQRDMGGRGKAYSVPVRLKDA